jgi:hypothetical protein
MFYVELIGFLFCCWLLIQWAKRKVERDSKRNNGGQ